MSVTERGRLEAEALRMLRDGYSIGQVADRTGLSTIDIRSLAATQPQRPRPVQPAPRVPGPLEQSAQNGATRAEPAPPAPQQSEHDQILERARQVPKLAKLVERHDKLMEQIEERLQVDEQAAKEQRQREQALERARAVAERARKDYEAAQATLRELGGASKTGKPKRELSDAQLASLRANAEKARAAAAAKRASNG